MSQLSEEALTRAAEYAYSCNEFILTLAIHPLGIQLKAEHRPLTRMKIVFWHELKFNQKSDLLIEYLKQLEVLLRKDRSDYNARKERYGEGK